MAVVVSVPHSGSQSLLKHLWNNASWQEREEGPWHIWHFGTHDEEIAGSVFPVLHIPMRNPVDIMNSWMNRGRDLADLYKSMESMATYTNPQSVMHKAEDLPVVINEGPAGPVRDRAALFQMLEANVSEAVLVKYDGYGLRSR